MPHAGHRSKTLQILQDYAKPFTDPDFPEVTIVPAWHGTKPESLDSIFKVGYSNLGVTDSGYFGKGLYSAFEAAYAHRVYSKGALVLNWVACYLTFPVVADDMSILEGKSNYANYDAHFVPVVPRDPRNQNETVFLPCQSNQVPKYREIVVFQSSACLPRYLVELSPVLTSSPTITYYANVKGFDAAVKLLIASKGKEAIPLLETAATKNCVPAFVLLYRLYDAGFGLKKKDTPKKETYFQKSAAAISFLETEASHPTKSYLRCYLGYCYQYGVGVPKSAITGAMHFVAAADVAQYTLAQYELANCSLSGRGIVKSDKNAAQYFKLAADGGHAHAQFMIGMYNSTDYVLFLQTNSENRILVRERSWSREGR